MEAGRLRHRVTVERRSAAPGAKGDVERTWAEVARVWARVSPVSGDERERAGRVEAGVTHEVAMRHRDIRPTDRIVFGTRVFQIASVRDTDERGVELVLDCREVVT